MHLWKLISSVTLNFFMILSVNGQIDFDQIKNVVENVVDLVQQSENYDCTFQCPAGSKKTPNKNHIPISNGCGSFGIDVDLSHLPSLVLCCDHHDVCYETCGRQREDCDKKFYQCLNSACEKAKRPRKNSNQILVSIDACKLTVGMIHQAVITLGCKSYLDAQKVACACKKYHYEL